MKHTKKILVVFDCTEDNGRHLWEEIDMFDVSDAMSLKDYYDHINILTKKEFDEDGKIGRFRVTALHVVTISYYPNIGDTYAV